MAEERNLAPLNVIFVTSKMGRCL